LFVESICEGGESRLEKAGQEIFPNKKAGSQNAPFL
jgi:hypothetical protein